MNERQPYEKHLADKLQHLPPPADINRSWEKMKALLDDDMPRGGGFGRSRWWIGGIILLILLVGTWITGTQLTSTSKPQPVAATPNTANTNPGNSTAKQELLNDAEKTNPPLTRSKETAVNTEPLTTGTVPGASAEDKAVIKTGKENNSTVKTASEEEVVVTNRKGNKLKNPPAAVSVKPVLTAEEKNKDNNIASNNSTIDDDNTTTRAGTNAVLNKFKSSTSNQNKKTNSTINAVNSTKSKENITKEQKPLLADTDNYLVDNTGSIISPSGVINEQYNAFTGAELFPHLANKKTVVKSKSSHAGKVMTAKTFAIGLSLPLGFPLGDQKALSYNRNAGVNTVSDYIPAPNLQYHFNSKTYVQTELQVFSPQFIRPILLYQEKQAVPASNDYIYNSVYAKKLYYFNLPVAIHHSPFKNFYMGTGLQFSTMLSGVALYEQVKRGPNMQDRLLSETYTRFSNDSLSGRFNGTEMRVLLDMNYYFNRFTVGLRYNQAVNNYVSFRVNNSSPYTYDKNKALQFYLRYNLWEDIKRKKPAKSFLSLKK